MPNLALKRMLLLVLFFASFFVFIRRVCCSDVLQGGSGPGNGMLAADGTQLPITLNQYKQVALTYPMPVGPVNVEFLVCVYSCSVCVISCFLLSGCFFFDVSFTVSLFFAHPAAVQQDFGRLLAHGDWVSEKLRNRACKLHTQG